MANKITQKILNDIVQAINDNNYSITKVSKKPVKWDIKTTKKSNLNNLKSDLSEIFTDLPEVQTAISNIKNISELLPIIYQNYDNNVSLEIAIKNIQEKKQNSNYDVDDFKRSGITR